MSQCSKEDGRSSSGPPYDMMEGRVGRTVTSASIEGKCPAVATYQDRALPRNLPGTQARMEKEVAS